MSSIYEDWPLPASVEAGDTIDPFWGNDVVECFKRIFGYTHVENYPQPIQVGKPSVLVLVAEGTSTIDFPNSVHVFLSANNVLYEEVAAVDFPYDGLTHVATLSVPIPKDYFVYWIAPYGFIKSAIMF
jgi:hypothetical protein